MASTHQRVFEELSDIHRQLHNEAVARAKGNVVAFKFFAKALSPVRDQGSTGACAYVSTVACTEMVYRLAGRSISGISGRYICFDVQDCFEHACKNPDFDGLGDSEVKIADTMGQEGTDVAVVLRYIWRYGLLSSCVCANPQERNPAAVFAPSPNRNVVAWYRQVGIGEVISVLETSPVIGVVKAYDSFCRCTKVFFDKPTTADNWHFQLDQSLHAVCLVGKFRVVSDKGEKQYVIIQNSYGTDYDFEGFVCAELKEPLFEEFWLPMLDCPP